MSESEYKEYLNLVKTITKNSKYSNDLLHDVLIQLESNEKWVNLNNKERKYFFTRTIQNQFYSNNSKFQRTYKKYEFDEIGSVEQLETIYEELPTLEWVYEFLDKEVKERPENWYNVGLFKMYLDVKKINLINKKTKIPKYSIRRTIKEMKVWINQRWEEYKDGENNIR